MAPVGGDLFVVGSTQRQQSQQSEKILQKLLGNRQNVHKLHQTVSNFFVKKKDLILTQKGKGYL